ncbi:hypothetical protein PF049_12775 [Erythrobacteraceae bacterium WH01K]|nr:hypothetical protein PF049_12775 [Erythrobacteraceae bacterium WH01K]
MDDPRAFMDEVGGGPRPFSFAPVQQSRKLNFLQALDRFLAVMRRNSPLLAAASSD